MGRWTAAFLAAFLIIACQTTAQAHSPYFTITQPIILPDGKPGELRFAHVDGIFGSDPIRAVILNSEGCMIARTRSSRIMELSCNGGNCRVFDLENDGVLELEPSTFRRGAIDHPMQDGENGEKCDKDVFGGLLDDEWGWRAREASAVDQVIGNIALLQRISLGKIGFFIGLSWFIVTIGRAAVACFGEAFSRGLLHGRPRGLVYRGICLFFGIVAAAVSLLVLLFGLFWGDDLTGWIWLGIFSTGALLSFVTFRILSIIARVG